MIEDFSSEPILKNRAPTMTLLFTDGVSFRDLT
jgi:hypothetical protein